MYSVLRAMASVRLALSGESFRAGAATEKTVGDIMRGSGRGNIAMTVTPSGEFSMKGGVEVTDEEIGRIAENLGDAVEKASAQEAQDRRLDALVDVRDDGATFDGKVVDESGLVFAEVSAYRTVALPGKRLLAMRRSISPNSSA